MTNRIATARHPGSKKHGGSLWVAAVLPRHSAIFVSFITCLIFLHSIATCHHNHQSSRNLDLPSNAVSPALLLQENQQQHQRQRQPLYQNKTGYAWARLRDEENSNSSSSFSYSSSSSSFFLSKDVRTKLHHSNHLLQLITQESLVFVGIFCRKKDYVERTLIRQTTMLMAPATAVTVRFVICHQESSGLDPFLWAEAQEHQDLYFLDCTENMNGGKSLQYFANVQHDFPGYHYYSKADTDTYILFHNLAMALDAAPRCAFYAGRQNDPVDGLPNFVSGSFYTLSRDLLTVLEACDPACADKFGPEDVNIGMHFKRSPTKIQYGDLGSNHSILYDRQPRNTIIDPWIVLLHPLKEPREWWRVHQEVIERVTIDAIVQAQKEQSWWDGHYTKIWQRREAKMSCLKNGYF